MGPDTRKCRQTPTIKVESDIRYLQVEYPVPTNLRYPDLGCVLPLPGVWETFAVEIAVRPGIYSIYSLVKPQKKTPLMDRQWRPYGVFCGVLANILLHSSVYMLNQVLYSFLKICLPDWTDSFFRIQICRLYKLYIFRSLDNIIWLPLKQIVKEIATI